MFSYIIKKYRIGNSIIKDRFFIETKSISDAEKNKRPSRTEIINFIIGLTSADNYLEIGVRNPENNFNLIESSFKYSVDPGVEFTGNPVDFKLTSDSFFSQLSNNKLVKINSNIKFDLIFIDGLHLAKQVERDIENSLKYIKDDGFIVLHDCNPPTEFHQRESYNFQKSPAGILWNGTTWKAFYKYRCKKEIYSICFDTDWGVGVISKRKMLSFNYLEEMENNFFEFKELEKNRKKHLNLQPFDKWKKYGIENGFTKD
jgi:hypothetical protein